MTAPQLRRLGRSELEIPRVVMGLWAAGGDWWGPPDDTATLQAIDRSLELGYNTFDTAPVYGYGHSEELLGKAANGRRQDLLILTKGGPVWDDQHRISLDLTPTSLQRQLDESLRRLQTDYIDLYQIHWPGESFIASEVIETLLAMKASGKVRAIGCSNYNLEQLVESQRYGQLDSLQPQFNMINDSIAEDILQYCQREEIGVITYGPLAKGILTGKYLEQPHFDEGDIRLSDVNFGEEHFQRINRFVQKVLKPLAQEVGITTAALALNWNFTQPGVTAAIAGIRSTWQVEQNVEMASIPPAVFERLEQEREKMKIDIRLINEKEQ